MLNLSKESIYLIHYYDKLIKNTKNTFLFSQCKKNGAFYKNFQKRIFKLLDNIYNLLDNELQNIADYRRIFNNNTREYKTLIKNIYNNHFINNKYINIKIKEYIRNEYGNLVIYQMPFKNKTISINIIKYSKISTKHVNYFDNLIKNIMAQIYLITSLTKNNTCSNDGLNIYLFLTPFKRELVKYQEEVLTSFNVNGGFCYGCVSSGEIVVYRQEELFKVFSHELVHNFGFDEYIWDFIYQAKVKHSKQNKIYDKFLNNFNLPRENELGIQECIVEFWGEFFNNAIYSYIYAKNSNLSTYNQKFEFFNQIFETLMKFEIIHSFLQSTKILDHNTYIELISKKQSPSYKERTHIFSYYILKMLLIFDYKEFINSQISITKDSMLLFNKSLKNMQNFLDYIVLISKNKMIITNLKTMREIYNSLKFIKNKNINLLVNNLRMSALEYY